MKCINNYLHVLIFDTKINVITKMMNVYAVAIHLFKTVDKCVFSRAAATLSLSSNCLLIACSDV